MPGRGVRFVGAIATSLTALALSAGGASATTFCVPTFHADCPNSGGNVAEADPEKAMASQYEDGIPDRVVIAAGTFTENSPFEPSSGKVGTFEPYGPDPLVIEGAGPGA